MTALGRAGIAACLLAGGAAHAQPAPPADHSEDAWDVMNALAARGLHDVHDEAWNLYGQLTYISSWKPSFDAPYTNLNGSVNSLLPDYERSFTATMTLFLGVKLWPGGQVYFAPEMVAERPLSELHGLGGSIQNFELQKSGSTAPQLYQSRLYLRQVVGLGGERSTVSSGPLQLAGPLDSRRLVITAGNFTVLDVLDRNSVTGDPRQTFFNIAFMTHSSWDFAADARGYSWGAAGELYWDDWAVRVARMAPPREPNTLDLDFDFIHRHSDAFELEHDHVLFGRPGAVRLLAYRNFTFSGRFDDAIAAFEADPGKNAAACPATSRTYGSTNAGAPDLCWVRKGTQKLGIGIDAEQLLGDDVWMFLRAMYSDGESEVDAYNSADRDFSLGAVAKGTRWGRKLDVAGAAVAVSWISTPHARYLEMGGVDGFVGDGALHRGAEGVAEAFYSVNLLRAIWLAADYQLVWNPGFNRDRGPVHIIGAKVHAEF